jgi:hypothetical protein
LPALVEPEPPGSGLGTGAAVLNPALPISVAPKGSPVGLTDVGGRSDESVSLSAQESGELPESPPPSNKAPGDPVLPDPLQFAVAAEGSGEDNPRVAISVDPSGMLCGRVDRKASGDVTPMPGDGCIPGKVAWPIAASGASHAMPAVNVALRRINPALCRSGRWGFCLFDENHSRMGSAPARLHSSDNREPRQHRYFQNARPAP